ncbi:DUF3592 domain-containing protein [Aquipseudomonas campi]
MKMRWLWLFPAIGILLIAIAVVIQVVRLRDESAMSRTTGQVIDIAGGCPTVEFSTQSGQTRTYRSNTCSTPPRFDIGDAVPMFYNPDKPSDARLNSFVDNWLGSLIVGGIGAVFTLLGSLFVLPSLLSRRRAAALAVTGQAVFADLAEVRLNDSLSVNGRSPWRIYAQWQNPATGKLHMFSSENIWFDPTRYLPEQQVRVLIDPQNPKRYSMDISFLPELAD